jgi:hypothetical protein
MMGGACGACGREKHVQDIGGKRLKAEATWMIYVETEGYC